MIMVKVYELRPDQVRWERQNSIEATHWKKLPGIRCPSCGVWGLTGIMYPTVATSVFNGIALPATPSPLSVEEFYALSAAIQTTAGAQRPVRPGTELGPLSGNAKGEFGDFAWVNSWTPLLRESVWLALRENGILLAGVRAELDFGKLAHEPLVEIEALPSARLPKEFVPEKCAVCGRLTVKRPDTIYLAASSLDASISLQRIAELPTVLVANQPFAQFIQRQHLRDVILVPIEVH